MGVNKKFNHELNRNPSQRLPVFLFHIQSFEFFLLGNRKTILTQTIRGWLACINPGSVPAGCYSKNGLPHTTLNHMMLFSYFRVYRAEYGLRSFPLRSSNAYFCSGLSMMWISKYHIKCIFSNTVIRYLSSLIYSSIFVTPPEIANFIASVEVVSVISRTRSLFTK